MNKTRVVLVVSALLSASAVAQQNQTQGQVQRQQFNPAMRAQLEKFRPITELAQTLRLISQVHEQKGLALSKAQATKLIAVVKDLQTRKQLKPEAAEDLLVKIEDTILSSKQLTWMDKQQIRPPGQGPGGANGNNGTNRMVQPGGQGNTTQRPPQGTGQGGRGNFQAMMTAANPFTVDPFKSQLASLMAVLQKVK